MSTFFFLIIFNISIDTMRLFDVNFYEIKEVKYSKLSGVKQLVIHTIQ